MKCLFKGCGTALATPFTADGVNYPELKRLLNFQIDEGIDAIIICGTTGEPSTMTKEEKREVIRCAVETVNGRVPVIAGTGGNNTAQVIQDSRYAKEVGADGILIVTPYYNKATQNGLVAHYTAVADAVDLPLIIYNVPARTGLNMTAETLAKLADHPNIYGMKEASGNISQIVEMASLCGDKISFYSGNDDQNLPILSVGAAGVISVASNILPKDCHELVAKFHAGDVAGSRQLQFKMTSLIKQLFTEVNPIPVKAALKLLGFDMGPVRLPLTELTEKNLETLKAAMQAYGLAI